MVSIVIYHASVVYYSELLFRWNCLGEMLLQAGVGCAMVFGQAKHIILVTRSNSVSSWYRSNLMHVFAFDIKLESFSDNTSILCVVCHTWYIKYHASRVFVALSWLHLYFDNINNTIDNTSLLLQRILLGCWMSRRWFVAVLPLDSHLIYADIVTDDKVAKLLSQITVVIIMIVITVMMVDLSFQKDCVGREWFLYVVECEGATVFTDFTK